MNPFLLAAIVSITWLFPLDNTRIVNGGTTLPAQVQVESNEPIFKVAIHEVRPGRPPICIAQEIRSGTYQCYFRLPEQSDWITLRASVITQSDIQESTIRFRGGR